MLNQGTSPEFLSTPNKHQNSNPLNHDHDYCSPNKHALPVQARQNNKHYSNDNLSDSSLSSSVSSVPSNKELATAQLDAMRLLAPQNTPSVPRCNKRALPPPPLEVQGTPGIGGMESQTQPQVTAGRSVRAKRARQSTSVTDKSEWIMGDEQIDSVLSEHLGHEHKEEKQHHHHHHHQHNRSNREHDSTFNQYTSSDYSSSDAESDHDSEYNSEDDPERLWCVCQKPHDGKFMIMCDVCMDWFHGHCVGVTKLMGDRFEKQGKEWLCSDCKEKINSGMSRSAIPKKLVKKETKKKTTTVPVPGKRGRGRPRKSETLNRPPTATTRASLRSTRKSSSSLDPKTGVDNSKLKKNLARSEARSESFDQFEDGLRLKELIKERKKEFFYKRHLAEQQKAAKRNELGLGRQSLTANLSDSLDSLATSTNAPTMINLPINIKPSEKEAPKPNIVLQINTKKDSGDQKNMSSRIVTTIVRSPKKTKVVDPVDPTVSDIFTAEPIQIHKKVKQEQTSSNSNNQGTMGDANTSNSDITPIKRSGSISSRNGSFDQGEITTPKKKRKDSESSTPNGSTTPIGSKHIIAKIKESLENRGRQIKDLEVSSNEVEELAKAIERQLNECFKEGTQKYLNKFRSLLFNLRDTKNQSLIKNVLTGEIEPSRLVRMSPEEMASHELAKWRERENKHSIELIKRDAQLAAQQVIVKKTHKGEEVIAAPAFNEPDDPTAVLDNQELPTTPTKQPSKDNNPESTTVVLTPPPTIGVINSTVAPLKMKITGIASNSSPPRALPVITHYTDPFWTGSISMPEVAKFSAKAKPVSGTIDFSGQELNRELSICGRIAPDQVQGYIKKIRTTTKNQIIIIQIFPLAEEDMSNFDIFFDYLYSRNRYGVISAKDHPDLLKDFYVLPIHENGSIPELLKPINGPGIDRSQPNCLLGLLVRNKRTPATSSSTATSSYTPTPIK